MFKSVSRYFLLMLGIALIGEHFGWGPAPTGEYLWFLLAFAFAEVSTMLLKDLIAAVKGGRKC